MVTDGDGGDAGGAGPFHAGDEGPEPGRAGGSDRRALSRREFLRGLGGAGLLLPVAALGGAAFPFGRAGAADSLQIGYISPAAGSGAGSFTKTALLGARMGASEADRTAKLLKKSVQLVERQAGGARAAVAAARQLAEKQGVIGLVGGFGTETCAALVDFSRQHGVLFFNVGSPADEFRISHCSPNAFHVVASDAMRIDATARYLAGSDASGSVTLVHPEGAAGRGHADRAAATLRAAGAAKPDRVSVSGASPKPPASLRGGSAAGAIVVLLRGEALAAFLSDAGRLKGLVASPFLGDLPPKVTGRVATGVWPVAWHTSLFKYGADQVDSRFQQLAGAPMDGEGWTNWVAVKAMGDAALKAGETGTPALVEELEKRERFDAAKGRALSFRPWDHQLRQPLYILRAGAGKGGKPAVVQQVPEAGKGEDTGTKELLDRIGFGASESKCGFSGAA